MGIKIGSPLLILRGRVRIYIDLTMGPTGIPDGVADDAIFVNVWLLDRQHIVLTIMWLSAHHSGNKYITSADAQESNNTLELPCRNHM